MGTTPRAIWGRERCAGEGVDAGREEQGKISRHLSLINMNVCPPLRLSSSGGHLEINECAQSLIVRKCLCVCVHVCVCVCRESLSWIRMTRTSRQDAGRSGKEDAGHSLFLGVCLFGFYGEHNSKIRKGSGRHVT